MKVKRKLDGTVDESSMDQEIHESDAIAHNMGKSGGLHLAELGLIAGKLASNPAIWLTKLGQGLKF